MTKRYFLIDQCIIHLMRAFLIWAILVSSCSSLNRNKVVIGSLVIKGGVYHSTKWGDTLVFDRYSWMEGLTLAFELLLVEVEDKSPFYNWFSESEKDLLKGCTRALVYLAYSQSSDKISQGAWLNQAEGYGYFKLAVPEFRRHLIMHPNYNYLSLKNYSVAALCLEQGQVTPSKPATIRFPGFQETEIKL